MSHRGAIESDLNCAACNTPVPELGYREIVAFCGDCRERSRPSDLPDFYDDLGGSE